MSSNDERYPMPEHDKRSLGCGLHGEVEAAYAYVESVSDTRDISSQSGWRGWALREAFLAGISHADAGKQADEVGLYIVLNNEKADRDAGGIFEGVFSSPDMARSFINRFPQDEQWRFEIQVVELDREV